ncbi:exocyst complex component 1-like isoform X1 [Montipora capricornis]|uniref:exocyst complex component 1-like isoform X1 n=1 Tax=Montipora capricornis TaxID=246305 RepID=UPI0035F13A65
MAAIKHNLQRDVFKPSEERLYAFVSVTKVGKKKKASFLCVAVTMVKPETVSIYQVKKTEKETYKKKRTNWRLKDLKLIDGKDETNENPEFHLHFDKTYKWVASSVQDKNNFILALWKLCERHLTQRKPTLLHVRGIDDGFHGGESIRAQQHTDEGSEGEDYQELTQREENDLEYMISQTENAISNIEAFTEQLSKDLSVLDGANIHSIMDAEPQVESLMQLLNDALNELDHLDTRLTGYDTMLRGVRAQMEQMEDKDKHMVTESRNRKMLLEEVATLVGILDVPEGNLLALQNADLSKGVGLRESTQAAFVVLHALQADFSPGLTKMRAVEEQRERFWQISSDFAQRLKFHLIEIFQRHGAEVEGTVQQNPSELCLPKHSACHKDLAPYSELMKWLKEVDQEVFKELCQAYSQSLSKVYERELRDFFEGVKQRTLTKGVRTYTAFRMTGSSAVNDPKMSPRPTPRRGSLRQREKAQERKDLDSYSIGSDSRSRSGSMSSVDSSDQLQEGRVKFEKVFDILLMELEPVCTAEQEFVQKFFDFTLVELEPSSDSSSSTVGMDSSDGAMSSKAASPRSTDPTDVKERMPLSEEVRRRKQRINKNREDMKKIMQGLFSVLETELQSYIHFADRLDNFNTMYMLVKIGHFVITTQLSGSPVSYLSQQLGNCLISVKRLFDKFISSLKKQIEDMKIQKTKKCGVLPFVTKFEEFAVISESVFKNSDRRTDLDKAYHHLIRVVFVNVERMAEEHQKTPRAVVMMENYHHLFRVLTRLKIICLENEKREAKKKYLDSQKMYVSEMLGRPMEKLNIFFEGVQDCIAAGVKEDEVGYQLAFSKQELRKCIKEYPAKELKKGLEQLYKKVEKHLCEEENLLQVVWHSMQDEFIQQYKHFDDLIQRCYPGSMINIEVSINDILSYFSNIAQSH